MRFLGGDDGGGDAVLPLVPVRASTMTATSRSRRLRVNVRDWGGGRTGRYSERPLKGLA